jgi:hypothetical protein
LGQIIKLLLIASGVTAGSHVLMEWIHGLLFGVALALAAIPLIRKKPVLTDGLLPRWTGVFCIFFLLVVLPYLNSRRSPPRWLQRRFIEALPEYSHGIAVVSNFLPSRGWIGWLEAVYLALGGCLLWLLLRHFQYPIPLVPQSRLGRGQLLYLVFLWLITFLSLVHVTPELRPLELWIQAAIMVHAIVCTVLMLSVTAVAREAVPVDEGLVYRPGLQRILAAGVLATLSIPFAGWAVERLLYNHIGGAFYTNHIRFGPNNTNTVN